ncbi:MAG: hypothetical protein HFF09_07615 [Oscillospiraceae bacterium]|nr:hypothetical protein [Oscillospiraceae bacterium]
MAKKKRFFVSYQQSSLASETKIIVDSMTGVNYLFQYTGNGGGMCVLVDADGKPLLTDVSNDLDWED